MKTLSFVVIMLFCFTFPAHAANVYAGCAVPPSTFGNVWYFDPVHGSTQAAGGNGSQAAPWNNLQALIQAETGYTYPLLTTAPYRQVPVAGQPAVTKTGPNAGPIRPGDEILLMSGNYGNVSIGGLAAQISNSDFVTVAAAPGQTPVLTSLFIGETNEWVFNGLKVQSLQSAALSGGALVQIKDAGATLPTSNIVLENMTISSTDDAEAWSKTQWIADARNGFSALSTAPGTNTQCISLTGSHISNVRFGASLTASKLVFSNNQIDHFGDDGIDYAASNLAITKNDIHDNLDIGDGNHEDAMQGQIGVLASGATVNYFQNILIDSNLIIRQSDPELAFPTYLQGIGAFDEDWTNVTVTNNIVITSACWGIAFSSIHKSLIANNTVVADGLVATQGCAGANVSVGDTTHEGLPSSDTVVRNNLTSQLEVYNVNNGVEADHNLVMLGSYSPEIAWYVNGAPQYIGNSGTYGTANIIDTGGAKGEFANFNPATLTYDVLLKANAQAISAGTMTGAPTLDILGVPRQALYTTTGHTTAGAYSYPE
jgi:Right handed beta helix region